MGSWRKKPRLQKPMQSNHMQHDILRAKHLPSFVGPTPYLSARDYPARGSVAGHLINGERFYWD